MSAVTNLGKVSVTPKGTWVNNTAYDILDIVAYQGSSYIAIQNVPSSGVPLSNASYWLMIASKGDGGEITSVSASISGGYGTPGVTVTEGGTDHKKTLAFAFTNLDGKGISSITQTTTSSVSGGTNVITCTLTDGNSTTFAILNGTDGDAINIAPAYDSTATYNLGDLVVYNDTLYECTTAIPVAEAWDSTHWTATDVSGQLSRKANIDGSYDLMNTGTSDNWTPYSADSGATQDIPFINEATGGGNGESVVDTGSYMQAKKKLGNTVAVNMPIKLRTSSQYGLSASMGADGVITISGVSSTVYSPLWENFTPIVGHYYLLGSSIVANPNNISFSFGFLNCSPNKLGNVGTYAVKQIVTSANSSVGIADFALGTDFTGVKIRLFVVDISLWFGSNDRIPADLLAHPENWGRYYAGSLAYNAGTLESADGTVLKSIGRNVWDEEWESGLINQTTGQNAPNADYIRSKNYIPIIPGQQYYKYVSGFSGTNRILYYDADKNYMLGSVQVLNTGTMNPPTGAAFARFYAHGNTYTSGITISLYYPGESGYDHYYPHSVLAEVDTGSEVLRSAGSVADEKTPDGTITRRVGYVDLGTLAWSKVTVGGQTFFYAELSNGSTADDFAGICPKYPIITGGTWTNDDKVARLYGSTQYSFSRVAIKDSAYSSGTAAAFKTAMSGVYLYYELATPTTEQGTAFAENAPCDDFGSLMWTQTKSIPQGVEIFYPVDYKASFDTLYNLVEGDMSAIATDDELQVVADRVPDAPSTDGTYSLKVSVSGGTKTYSWVADE